MSSGQTGLPTPDCLSQTASPAATLDRQLLDRFVQRQDEAAFAALVQRHGPTVMRVCRGVLRDAHQAEDAFQATFLVLVRRAPAIRKRKSVGSWLHKVAYRIALAARASAALRLSRENLAPGKEPPTQPLTEITGRELMAALDEELAQLADRHRAPLVLCLLQGRTRDEAAEQLGWSLSTLKRRLERGREVLRARLDRRGLALSAVLAVTLLAQQTAAALLPAFQPGAAMSTRVSILADGALQALPWPRLVLPLLLFLVTTVSLGSWGTHGASSGTPIAPKMLPAAPLHDPLPPPERKVPAYTTDRYGDPPSGLLPEKKEPVLM